LNLNRPLFDRLLRRSYFASPFTPGRSVHRAPPSGHVPTKVSERSPRVESLVTIKKPHNLVVEHRN